MIKKIVLLLLMLLYAVGYYAFADNSPEMLLLEDRFVLMNVYNIPNSDAVKIECDIKTIETTIGGEFICDVSVTNTTDYQVAIYAVDCNLTQNNEWGITYNSGGIVIEKAYILAPHETVAFNINDKLSDAYFNNGHWYKEGDEFYYPFILDVYFSLAKEEELCVFKNRSTEDVSVKITNIYDGSEILETEWLDDRDSMYFYNCVDNVWNVFDEAYASPEYVATDGYVYYDLACRSLVDGTISFLFESDGGEIHNIFSEFFEQQMIPAEVEETRKLPFIYEGKYYGIEASRKYKTVVMEKPDIAIKVNKKNEEDTEPPYEVIVSVINNGDKPVKNFFVIASEEIPYDENSDNFKTGTLNPYETWDFEFSLDHEYISYQMKIGYLLDGMLFCWFPECREIADEEITLVLKDQSTYYSFVNDPMLHFDYERYISLKALETETSLSTLSPEPTVTPLPTLQSSQSEGRLLLPDLIIFLSGLVIVTYIVVRIKTSKKQKKKDE